MVVPLNMPATALSTDLEHLRERPGDSLSREKEKLREATREFESFFIYEMLKNMRRTIPENSMSEGAPMSSGSGKETFTSLFDMEIARKTELGWHNSIADLLYNAMEPLLEARHQTVLESPELKPLRDNGTQFQHLDDVEPVPLPEAGDVAPVSLNTERPEIRPLPQRPELPQLPALQARCPIQTDPVLSRWGTQIETAARETELDSSVIAAVIRAESNGDPKAVSRAGAKGLMQLMDTTAQDLNLKDPFDPGENIRAGSRYLKKMVDRFGDLKLALAAYNAGPGNVDKYGGVPLFSETREYIERIASLLGRSL